MSTSRSEVLFAALLLALIGLCGGCHDPYSNQLFEDDELFIAAIPDEERVTARVPETSSGGWSFASATDGDDVGQIALYPLWTIQTAGATNEFIFMLLYLVEAITDQPIDEREDALRVGGPYPTDAGHEVTFEMTRDGERFDYALLWDTATAEDLAPFTGSFVAGEIPREGIGAFMFDFELYAEDYDGARKPDRRMFDAAIAATGRPPCELAHVGESLPQAVAGALSVRAVAVWLNRATAPCDADPSPTCQTHPLSALLPALYYLAPPPPAP